jgi:hypothetical protein
MISEFSSQGGGFTYANFVPWCSTLAALPSLERAQFGLQEPETQDQRVLLNLEPLKKELLRAPALRVVAFDGFYFSNELCHARANVLEEGSSILTILESDCSFPDGVRGIIANALKTNTSITSVQHQCAVSW